MKNLAACFMLALAAACTGETGTLSVQLITAPGSTVLDEATHARITLTEPRTVVEADRDGTGFALELEVPADGVNGALLFEAMRADGTVIAVGQSPAFPVAAITADLTIYVAAPMSMAASPAVLSPARSEVAVGPLAYGALLAGGRGPDGVARADVGAYSVYNHTLAIAAALPAARANLTFMIGTIGYGYMFGGEDSANSPSGTGWSFNPGADAMGAYTQLFDVPAQPRVGASAAPLGFERFLVTGSPALVFDGFGGGLNVISSPAQLTGVARSVEDISQPDAPVYTIIVGDGAGTTGLVQLVGADFTEFPAPASATRSQHGAATIGTDIIVVGGAVAGVPVASALRINAVTGAVGETMNVLSTPRVDAAVAIAGAYLVVAGGTDSGGNVCTDVEVFNAATLARVAVIPMVVPRTAAAAQALTNGSVLVVGGVDVDGQPTATIELFTPPIAAAN